MITEFFNRLDLDWLAGTRRVLGIDLTERRVRVVEFEKRRHILDRFRPRFRVRRSFSLDFESGLSLDQKANLLRESLTRQKVKTTQGVSSVQTPGVKVISAAVPPDVSDVDEWISDNSEKLLKMPLDREQISYRFELLEKNQSSLAIEVTFIRNSDIEECKSFFEKAGLQLLDLGGTTRDSVNAYLAAEPASTNHESCQFIYMGEDIISITHLSKGKRTQSLYSSKNRGTNLPPENQQFACCESTSGELITAGEAEDEQHPFFRPFGISSRYVLAVGLAVKGFLPELSPVSFLSRAEKENTETRMYRSATQRMALVLGSAVLFLLLIPIGIGQIIQTKISGIDEILLSSGTLYGEVAALEEQVKNLESRLDGSSPSTRGTNLSKILHDFAGVVPEGVSLTKLTVLNPNPPQAVLSLTGNAKSNELVAELLRDLQENVGFSEVSLVRSGSALQSVLPVGSLKDSPSVSFEIRATATY